MMILNMKFVVSSLEQIYYSIIDKCSVSVKISLFTTYCMCFLCYGIE